MATSETFHHYRVQRTDDGSLWELGRGGMGVTFKALDTELDRVVALKVISPVLFTSEQAQKRFQREARALARLRHQNVPWVYHFGREGEEYFYAMEFVEGETTEALVKQHGPLETGLALRIVIQVTEALSAAHKAGLVHRDIKPSNVMLVQHEEAVVVKLIDFGLAKFVEREMAVTLPEELLGTPHFASPEQLGSGEELDARSDVYSLGATLWYLLTGTPPFSGGLGQVISQHLNAPPDFARLAGQPAALVALLGRMLAKNPADRPQTPAALKQALEECGRSIDPESSPAAFEPAASDAKKRATGSGVDEIDPAPGTLLGGRYRIAERIRHDSTGKHFRAEDIVQRRVIALTIVARELWSGEGERTFFTHELEKAVAAEHPNLIGTFAFATEGETAFFAQEWLTGFSLAELLRARRELPLEDALPLLEQMAEGIDYAIPRELSLLALSLSQITLHFPNGLDDAAREQRLRVPPRQWPDFLIKIDPCALASAAGEAVTWQGERTIVPPAVHPATSGENLRTHYLRSFAGLCCELLGARARGLDAARGSQPPAFSPLPALSETGNAVLKSALLEPSSFENAHAFVEALKAGDEHPLPKTPARGVIAPQRPMSAPPPREPRRGRTRVGWVLAAAAVVVGLSFAWMKNAPTPEPPPMTPAPLPPLPHPGATPPPLPPDAPIVILALPKPAPAEISGASPLARAVELLAPERTREEHVRGFEMLKSGVLARAAKAMELLGGCYLEGTGTAVDYVQAHVHFDRALTAGNDDARVGLAKLYMEGLGGPREPVVAVNLLSAGAAKGNAACMLNLALCLEAGAGVERNQGAAVTWRRKAAEASSAKASAAPE